MNWLRYIPIVGQIFAIIEARQANKARELELERARQQQCTNDQLRKEGADHHE